METLHRPGFTIHGIAIRTTNAEQGPDGPIARAWREAVAAGLIDRARTLRTNLVAAYTEYESDAGGAYTFVLGIRAPEGAAPLPGERVFEVPPARVARFHASAAGQVPATWSRIWEAGLPRAYTVDVEEYAADDGSASVDVALAA